MKHPILNEVSKRSCAYWSQRAEEYSKLHDASRHKELCTAYRNILRNLMPRIDERPIRALDVGCGSGFMSLILAELHCDVTAVDFSKDMLTQAKRNIAQVGAKNITFLQKDIQHLTFEANSFDFVVSRNVFWVLPNALAAYTSVMNVLAPKGILINFDANYGSTFNAATTAGNKPEHPTQSLEQLLERNAIVANLPITQATRPAWDLTTLLHLGASEVRCFQDAERMLGIKAADHFSTQASNHDHARLFIVYAQK